MGVDIGASIVWLDKNEGDELEIHTPGDLMDTVTEGQLDYPSGSEELVVLSGDILLDGDRDSVLDYGFGAGVTLSSTSGVLSIQSSVIPEPGIGIMAFYWG